MKYSGKWRKCSQAKQDLFVHNLIGKNGTYVEIGGHLPARRSNTYNLVVHEGWNGFSIEFDRSYQKEWEACYERNTKVYWGDAIIFDYAKASKDLGFNTHFNYLSVDIEPPSNTFAALQKVINDGITFDIITFEHDSYQCDENFHTKACEFLLPLGYKVAVYDVWSKRPERLFETWFISEKIDFPMMPYSNWLKSQNLLGTLHK